MDDVEIGSSSFFFRYKHSANGGPKGDVAIDEVTVVCGGHAH